MAAADYYLCDVCGNKTFYDAELHYDGNENPDTHHERPVGVGHMVVLCQDCAKTHKVIIEKR